MKINCIIVEDEPLAMERAKLYVQKIPFLNLLSTFENATDASEFLKHHKADLLFLDIHLGELSGMQLLETARIPGEVILTTAYHEYAVKGFDLNITDYLLKPYTFERFYQAVEKAQANLLKTVPGNEKKFVFIKTEYRLEKILLSEVLYIEGMRDYRKIHTLNKKIMTLKTFTDLEKEIPPELICRVHKSYMVSIDKIDSIEKDQIKIRDTFIPISESYKKSFFERINHPPK